MREIWEENWADLQLRAHTRSSRVWNNRCRASGTAILAVLQHERDVRATSDTVAVISTRKARWLQRREPDCGSHAQNPNPRVGPRRSWPLRRATTFGPRDTVGQPSAADGPLFGQPTKP